jgi:hypothetical protein
MAVLSVETLIVTCSAMTVAAAAIGIRVFWRRGKRLEDL